MLKRRARLTAALLLALSVAALAAMASRGTGGHASAVHRNTHAQALERVRELIGVEAGTRAQTLAEEQYENRALPAETIAFSQQQGADNAFERIDAATTAASSWQELGPFTPTVPATVTDAGRVTTNSGRITALAASASCTPAGCRLVAGAAGGGVWWSDNPFAATPTWHASTGIDSGAIGSLAIDPSSPSTVYAGTGEPNGSGDSEAGVGLYKSTDGGQTFTVVAGSVAVSKDRSIGAIAVDPTNAAHLYIGTDVARHGSSASNGGRRTPPNAPTLGLYESTDGGGHWSLAFSRPGNPTPSSTGNDWFQGGVNDIELDPNTPSTVYFSLFGYGAWKKVGANFTQIFQTMNPADTFGDRTEIAPADLGTKTRLYLADASDDLGRADLFRTDDAAAVTTASWTRLSSPDPSSPGYASYNFCGGQCGYDMPLATPPGAPDSVWIGGQMQYDEIGNRSNGRAVQRSVDAGASFTDTTQDAQTPHEAQHPDQHAIVFASSNPDIAFLGSDGGVIRTSGAFSDNSARCDARGLSGTDLSNCKAWLSKVPSVLTTMNDGLRTIQFQSLSLNPLKADDLQGGTQDNGTWWNNGVAGSPWGEAVGGDGGQSGFGLDGVRGHTYFDAQVDFNFSNGTDITDWNWVADPLWYSHELRSFYIPMIADPKVPGSWFVGMQSIWRTTDNGGDKAYLQEHCNEYHGDFQNLRGCGDWVALGSGNRGDLTSAAYGGDKIGHYVVATERAPSDSGTLWAGTRVGRVFITKNADDKQQKVSYTRIDTPDQPNRFVSSIYIDPANANHAWISFSGYDAYTTAHGHVFEVTFNPATGTATWTNLSYDIGDQPVTDLVRDDNTGTLYAGTDFGVLSLAAGATHWSVAGNDLPPVAVYGLTISSSNRALYAATHGRGAWKLTLP